MAFGVGGRESRVFHGFESKTRGSFRQIDVACECWFTSRGETIHLALKFPDENGELVMVKSIQVDCAEKKYYCGIPAVEYTCRIVHRGRTQPVRLIFYLEECRWVMEIPEAGLSRSDD